jgi:hypothetical protein
VRLETDAPLRLGALIRSSISIRVHDSLTADDLAYRGSNGAFGTSEFNGRPRMLLNEDVMRTHHHSSSNMTMLGSAGATARTWGP